MAARFDPEPDRVFEEVIGPAVRARGHCTRDEFLALCEWKSPRSRGRCARNSAELVEEATRTAFTARSEPLRVGVLTLLDGVSWPTASVILHFCHPDPYPVMDYRALWSLGVDTPPAYTFDFWWEYTLTCRELARRLGIGMRELDRGLWQYAKERAGATP
jgi:hypothetical protein